MKCIALVGNTGIGKSLWASEFKKIIGDECLVISGDGYYTGCKIDPEMGYSLFDDYHQIDFNQMYRDIMSIINRNPEAKIQNVISFLPHVNERLNVDCSKIKYLIIEGFLMVCNNKIRSLFDEIIWIRTDDKISYEKREIRDKEVRKHPLWQFLTKSGYDAWIDVIKPIVLQIHTIVVDNDYKPETMSNFISFYLEKGTLNNH